MKNFLSDKNLRITLVSVIALLLLWEGASRHIASDHILPGPWATLKAAFGLLCSKSFLKVVGGTVLRALAGFAVAVASGVILGSLGGLHPSFHTFMRPWVVVMRSTPVIAFALLAIIWLDTDAVPVFISLMTMFPIIYLNVIEGMGSVDVKAVEMARFYGVRGGRLLREVFYPAIRPFLYAGISTAVGMGWRAVVVGEVLSQPQWGIGSVMRVSQTFLQVDILIAWTLVAILIGAAFEKLIRIVENGHHS